MTADSRMAVFIEPHGELHDLVVAWKSRIARRWPAAAYVDHPPHATVWVGDVRSCDEAEHSVTEAVSRVVDFSIAIRGPHVFYDDAPAGGGQTCAFAAKSTDLLAHLQRAVAGALREHRTLVSDDRLSASLRQEPFLQSWREFGFPFVGPHWIPHFTIASLPVRRDDPVLTEFLSTMPSCEMALGQLGWWRITAGRHERLATLPLARRMS